MPNKNLSARQLSLTLKDAALLLAHSSNPDLFIVIYVNPLDKGKKYHSKLYDITERKDIKHKSIFNNPSTVKSSSAEGLLADIERRLSEHAIQFEHFQLWHNTCFMMHLGYAANLVGTIELKEGKFNAQISSALGPSEALLSKTYPSFEQAHKAIVTFIPFRTVYKKIVKNLY